MRRRHLESVSAAPYGRCFRIVRIQPQLSVKGVCKGESLVPLCPVLLPFAGAKGRPPRRAGDNYAFAKGPAPPPGAHKLALNSHNISQLHFPNKTHHLSNSHPVFSHFVNLP